MKPRLLIALGVIVVLSLLWFGYQRRHAEMTSRDDCQDAGGRWMAETRSCEGARPAG